VCRTLLNIAESQELAGDDYSVIKASYDEALKHAAEAKDRKLQVESKKTNPKTVLYAHCFKIVAP